VLPDLYPWPLPFVVKANHGCKQFVVVRCEADWVLAKRLAPHWLKGRYGGWLDEWHYRHAERFLFVEPFIGPDVGLPLDYKVFVFAGVAEFIQVHLDRANRHRWIQFDRNWNQLSASEANDHVPAPSRFEEMLMAAELMARDRDHLRVDFYQVGGRLWFGECCLFPGSGLDKFQPASLDAAFGQLWTRARQGSSMARQSTSLD
jgi:hypothetical protein